MVIVQVGCKEEDREEKQEGEQDRGGCLKEEK